jgi:A/G-specific adenine glycosylase
MLQQTRVETVLPYFERFLRIFPTLSSLAQASPAKVLKAWAGLGYYARARNLQEAAKIIQRDFEGQIPSQKKILLSLPGFGPYTAGAVASLAFNRPEPALDGNVRRVLLRLLGLQKSIPENQPAKYLENFIKDFIPAGRASDFNQALMELGALICMPGKPKCPFCPLKNFCSYERAEDKGKNRSHKKIRKEIWVVAVVEQENRFLLHCKEGKGLLAGLWQFPTVVVNPMDPQGVKKTGRKKEREALRRMLQTNFNLRIKIKGPLPPQEHSFTHLQVSMKPFLCSVIAMPPVFLTAKNVRWIKPANLSRYPVSKAMSKIAALIFDSSKREDSR